VTGERATSAPEPIGNRRHIRHAASDAALGTTDRSVTVFAQVNAPLVDMAALLGAVTDLRESPAQRSGDGAVRAVSGRAALATPGHTFWPVRGTFPPRQRV
jgi:hypothetical protein